MIPRYNKFVEAVPENVPVRILGHIQDPENLDRCLVWIKVGHTPSRVLMLPLNEAPLACKWCVVQKGVVRTLNPVDEIA